MIKVEALTKVYRLYKTPSDRLKEALSFTKKKYHEDFYALKELSFEIKPSQTVGIIGNNGSGKSTLLKLITGVLNPTSGKVSLSGSVTALLELGSGLDGNLDALENIKLHSSINGHSNVETKLKQILDFADIGTFAYQPIKTYSSGMKARLGFALAIHSDPDVLIIDEALSVGDASFARKCFAKIESFKKEGKTILFVSHSIGQVINLCDYAIWIDKGELVLKGDTKAVTGLYQKYGGVKNLDFKKIRHEYEQMLSSSDKKAESFNQKAFFNKKLKPKSTIEYTPNGAKIKDVKVLSNDLKECNTLYKNETYFFSYNVSFEKDHDFVRFAMLLKTTNGIALGGKELELAQIKADKTYAIKWKFKAILNSGYYFFNCGINTDIDGEKVVLHRVIDAAMIQIAQTKKEQANGFVDFGFEMDVEEYNG